MHGSVSVVSIGCQHCCCSLARLCFLFLCCSPSRVMPAPRAAPFHAAAGFRVAANAASCCLPASPLPPPSPPSAALSSPARQTDQREHAGVRVLCVQVRRRADTSIACSCAAVAAGADLSRGPAQAHHHLLRTPSASRGSPWRRRFGLSPRHDPTFRASQKHPAVPVALCCIHRTKTPTTTTSRASLFRARRGAPSWVPPP